MLITEEYRALNRALHESNAAYGTSGHKWAGLVSQLVHEHACTSALDYGCGKQTLAQALGHPRWLTGYDPAIQGLNDIPVSADMVVCGDVLEHVEPCCLESVMDDIKRVTRKLAVFVIATRPAMKTLADGRNAHLIVQPPRWWLLKLLERFDLANFNNVGGEFIAVMTPRTKMNGIG